MFRFCISHHSCPNASRWKVNGKLVTQAMIGEASFPLFWLSSSLALRVPLFWGFSGFIMYHFCNTSQTTVALMSRTKQQWTDNRRDALCLQEKAHKRVSIVIKELSITAIKEAWQATNHQIKDSITVSYFSLPDLPPLLFAVLPLDPHKYSQSLWLKSKIRDCLQSKGRGWLFPPALVTLLSDLSGLLHYNHLMIAPLATPREHC